MLLNYGGVFGASMLSRIFHRTGISYSCFIFARAYRKHVVHIARKRYVPRVRNSRFAAVKFYKTNANTEYLDVPALPLFNADFSRLIVNH